MSVNLSILGNGFQFLNTDGLPLNGGKIYTYQAGSSTPLTTYSDVGGLVANANPIILGTDGRPPNEIWLTYGYFYKFVLKDSDDVTIQTYDNLYGALSTIPATPASAVPTGCIMLWSGSIGSIPSGWYLCNGSNGTPDLRDKFIVGAGSTYAVNGTGGSADAIVVTHTHTATSTQPAHNHTYNDWRYTGYNTGSYGGGAAFYAPTSGTTGNANPAITTTIDSVGTSGTGANLPPYYALCYIMKG